MDIICILLIIYSVVPNIHFRHFSKKIIRKSKVKDRVLALTFDDGPDPEYTPALLDLLRENDVKSTFFVLADKAAKYPELIKRIINEGHSIGLHSYKHITEAILPPINTKRFFLRSMKVLDELGVNVNLFRPPWGVFNALTYHYAKLCNCKIVLWSIHAYDWSKYATVDFIKNRLINKVKPGDIILLHDGKNSKGTPERTIAALETVIPVLKRQGYSFLLVKDMQ